MNGVLKENFYFNPTILKQRISSTDLTIEWILKKLVENVAEFRNLVEKYKIVDIETVEVSCNSGFMANVYRTIITFENDQKFNFIMKIPSIECFYGMMNKVHESQENHQSMTKEEIIYHMERFHNTECEFYEKFPEIPGFPIPNVYFSQKYIEKLNQQGIIVMEDLNETGKLVNILNSYSVSQIKNIVKHIASFHTFFLSINEDRWKNRFLDLNQIPILQLEGFKRTPSKLAKLQPGVFDELLDKLQPIFSDEMMRWTFQGCCKELGLPSIMCHGDVWSNNMFWKTNPDGSASDEVRAFFDLQLTFEGNPALDMTRVIVLNTDTEVRKELETFILEYYFDNLKSKMAQNGKSLPESWTLEMIKKAYYTALPTEAGLLTTITAFFIDTPNINSEEQESHNHKVENLIFRTKNALEDALQEVLKNDDSKWFKN